jgi:hypothetical protein
VVPPYFRKSLNRKYGWIIPVVELIVAAALVVGSVFTVGRVVGAFNQAAAKSTPTLAPMLSPSATPVPTVDLQYAYREDFNDPQFEGTLPPTVRVNGDACSTATVSQANGSLTVETPKGSAFSCGVNLGDEYRLSGIKAVEFALTASASSSIRGFAVSMFSHGSLSFGCGLAMMSAGSGCFVQMGGGGNDVFQTKVFQAKAGTKYTFRMEVLDPDKMTFRFLVNGGEIGDYTLLASDAAANNDVNFFAMMGVNPMSDPSAAVGSYSLDYLAIEQP